MVHSAIQDHQSRSLSASDSETEYILSRDNPHEGSCLSEGSLFGLCGRLRCFADCVFGGAFPPTGRRAVLAAASASKRLRDLRSVTMVLFIDQFLRAARPLRWWPSSLSSIILVTGAGGLLDDGRQLVDGARNREKSFDDVGRLAIAVRASSRILLTGRYDRFCANLPYGPTSAHRAEKPVALNEFVPAGAIKPPYAARPS